MMWNEPMPCWRKAQKSHQCHGDACTITISKGDKYLDQAVIRPKNNHRRYCQECAEDVWDAANSYHYFRGRNDWPNQYQRHIASAAWKRLRSDIIEERGNKCERCGRDGSLHLHHKTYKSLGNEQPDDVELLCNACHIEADRER